MKHFELQANYSTNTSLIHPLNEPLMDIEILNFWIRVIVSCLQSANIILLPSNELVMHVSMWELLRLRAGNDLHMLTGFLTAVFCTFT